MRMMGYPTRLVLCRGPSALDVVRTPTLSPPHGLTFHHHIGTRVFVLSGVASGCVPLLVTCRVPNLVINPVGGGAVSTKSNRARMQTKTLPMFSTTPSVPVLFRCALDRRATGLEAHLDVHCRSVLGQLVVDGVAFVDDDVPSICEGPETMKSSLAYQGPTLNQCELADFVVGRTSVSNPLSQSRQATSVPFDEVFNYEVSSFSKFGHNPVHTVNSRLVTSLGRTLASVGVDDELAEFVALASRHVQKLEYEAWSRITRQRFSTHS